MRLLTLQRGEGYTRVPGFTRPVCAVAAVREAQARAERERDSEKPQEMRAASKMTADGLAIVTSPAVTDRRYSRPNCRV